MTLQTRSSGKKVSRRTETRSTNSQAERKMTLTKSGSSAKKRMLRSNFRRASDLGMASILFSNPFSRKKSVPNGGEQLSPGRARSPENGVPKAGEAVASRRMYELA